MTSDDKHQSEDGELTAAEQEAIDAFAATLGDPATWAEPPAGLQEQVVAAITEARQPERPGVRRYALLGAAAAIVLAVGVTLGLTHGSGNDPHQVTFAATLVGTPLAPRASGSVTLTRTTSGWKIHLHAQGLPRRADGAYYEAWLKSPAGVLVPVGTFNSFEDVTLWAGVPPTSHPTFTVTRQLADGNPASTGQVVLSGTATPSR